MLIAKALVEGQALDGTFTYSKINEVSDYHGEQCIVVKTLDPDYSLLLGDVQVIMSENGSALSHLAILAMEYGKTIILINGTTAFKRKGRLKISRSSEGISIETE